MFKNKFLHILFILIFIIILFYILNNKLNFSKLELFNNNTKYKINSFTILLPNNYERRENVKLNEKKYGKIKSNIYDAVVGKTLNLLEIKKFNDNNWLTNTPKRMNEIGCFLSHKYIIEKNSKAEELKNNYDYTIIFEDDLKIICTDLNKEVIKILDKLKSIKNDDFDIIFLGNLKKNHGKKIIDNIYTLNKKDRLLGTHCYLINNKSASKILNLIQKLDRPIDIKYEYLLKNELLKGFIIYPILVTQNGFDSTINLNNKQFNQKFLK